MVLVTHIIIALSSVIYTTYLLVAPSQLKFRVSYTLVASTILSGTYLVLRQPATMVRACIAGVFYIGMVSVAIIIARQKFAIAEDQNKID